MRNAQSKGRFVPQADLKARTRAFAERVSSLREEARQLVAIAVSSIRTARRTPSAIPHSAFRIPH